MIRLSDLKIILVEIHRFKTFLAFFGENEN